MNTVKSNDDSMPNGADEKYPFSNLSARIIRPIGAPLPGADYEVDIGDELGSGGMGIIYKARHIQTDRDVALKITKNPTRRNNARLVQEALTVAKLEHPAIIPLYDIAVAADGNPFDRRARSQGPRTFLVMRKLPKGNIWKPGERDLDSNLATLETVAGAVAFAHDQGALHLDLKPGNIMLGENGEVFVMDWGLSQSLMESANHDPASPGFVCGTPAYASPECARGDGANIGKASDLYLLGAILFEILHGCPPHKADSEGGKITMARNNTVIETPVRDDLAELHRVAMRAMAGTPSERQASVKAFMHDFVRLRRSPEFLGMLRDGENLRKDAAERQERGSRDVYEKLEDAGRIYAMAEKLLPERHPLLSLLRPYRARLALTYAEQACLQGDMQLAQTQLDVARNLGCEPGDATRLDADVKMGIFAAHQAARGHRRLKILAGMTLAAVIVLIAMAGHSLMEWKRTYDNSRDLIHGMVMDFIPDLQEIPGANEIVKVFAERINGYFREQVAYNASTRFLASKEDNIVMAQTFLAVGKILEYSGDHGAALSNLEESLKIYQELHAIDPGNPECHFGLARIHFRIGWNMYSLKRQDLRDSALANTEKALDLLQKLQARRAGLGNVDPEEVLDDLHEADFIKHVILQDRFFEIQTAFDGYARIAGELESVLERRRRAGSKRMGDIIVGIRLSSVYGRMRRILFRQGRKQEAWRYLKLLREANQTVLRMAPRRATRLDVRRNDIFAQIAEIDLTMDLEEYLDHENLLNRIDLRLQDLRELEPHDEWLNHFWGIYLRKRYEQSLHNNEFDKAAGFLEDEIASREEFARDLSGEYPRNLELATACLLLGDARMHQDRKEACLAAFQKAGAILDRAPKTNPSSESVVLAMKQHIGLAKMQRRWNDGDPDQARDCLEKTFLLYNNHNVADWADWKADADLALLDAYCLRALLDSEEESPGGFPALIAAAEDVLAARSGNASHLYRFARALLSFGKDGDMPELHRRELLDLAKRAIAQALALERRERYEALLAECEEAGI